MTQKRNITLDFFRFTAFMLVLLHHIFLGKLMPLNHQWNVVRKAAFMGAWALRQGGSCGVDLFFVLSGFLISGLIFKEYDRTGRFSAGRFLVRRGFKIYPLYYMLLVVYFACLFLLHLPINKHEMASLAFFYFNYTGISSIGLGHLWSISVEEHFYFFLAFLLFLMIRKRSPLHPILTFLFLFFTVACLAFRINNYYFISPGEEGQRWVRTAAYSHVRFDSLFTGVYFSYLSHYKGARLLRFITRYRIILLVLSIAAISQNFNPFVNDGLKATILLTLSNFGFAFVMLIFMHYRWIEKRFFKPFAVMGEYSYSLYLVHIPILTIFSFYIKDNLPLFFMVSVVTSLLAGVLISKTFEWPILRFRERVFPSTTRAHKPAIRAVSGVAS